LPEGKGGRCGNCEWSDGNIMTLPLAKGLKYLDPLQVPLDLYQIYIERSGLFVYDPPPDFTPLPPC